MREFHLEIVTPDGSVFSGGAAAILVRTDSGDVEILAGHSDYFATLGIGRAKLTLPSGESRLASCAGGILSVDAGVVRIAATTFEFADEIDLERAKRAKASAEEKIKTAADDRALLLAKAKLARAVSRINVAELK